MATIDFSTILQLDHEDFVPCAGKEIQLSELDGMNWEESFSDFGRNDPELLLILAESEGY